MSYLVGSVIVVHFTWLELFAVPLSVACLMVNIFENYDSKVSASKYVVVFCQLKYICRYK